MSTAIVLLVLLLIGIFAIKGSIKHFRGQGGCCGGGPAPKRAKKRLKAPVQAVYRIKIEGMHCAHCQAAVERALNELDGAAAKVNLKRNEARVRAVRQMENIEMEAAVKEAGYTAVSIVKES